MNKSVILALYIGLTLGSIIICMVAFVITKNIIPITVLILELFAMAMWSIYNHKRDTLYINNYDLEYVSVSEDDESETV